MTSRGTGAFSYAICARSLSRVSSVRTPTTTANTSGGGAPSRGHYPSHVRLDVRFAAVPVEAMRAFLEPLGYRFDWGPELDGIGFHWRKQPLSGTGVRATYFPDGSGGL